jgi:hypothetical protein
MARVAVAPAGARFAREIRMTKFEIRMNVQNSNDE